MNNPQSEFGLHKPICMKSELPRVRDLNFSCMYTNLRSRTHNTYGYRYGVLSGNGTLIISPQIKADQI